MWQYKLMTMDMAVIMTMIIAIAVAGVIQIFNA